MVFFTYATQIDDELKVVGETIKFVGERHEVRHFAAMHAITSIPLWYEKFHHGEGDVFYE